MCGVVDKKDRERVRRFHTGLLLAKGYAIAIADEKLESILDKALKEPEIVRLPFDNDDIRKAMEATNK